jgi:tetratricopeptide (TPR) repeat protein
LRSFEVFCAFVFALSVALGGCAETPISSTPDLAAQLKTAEGLYEEQANALTAETLIWETMQAYRNRGNQLGLAEAYRAYGFFLRSEAVEGKWSAHYNSAGFLDPSVTFATRYEKSIDYLEKARTIFTTYGRYDALTNVNLNIGFTYEVLGNPEAACRAFENSIGSNREGLERHAKLKITLPKGYATYEDFLAPHRKRAGCETAKPRRPRKQPSVMSA